MLTVKRLSHDDAAAMIAAAEAKAGEIGVPMCIAVTDESGALISFSRMDGGKFSSIRIAIDKAYTAAAARNPTSFYGEICHPGHPTFGIHVTNEGHFCIIGGGVPVLSDGEVIGAIGVSSGTPDQDIMVAEAGVAAMEGRI
ncbi:MAG: heme-binding protein [Alphaproteobacteria bacterium]|nr:heme-binding protein [Alphaproteobacteria bacterium]